MSYTSGIDQIVGYLVLHSDLNTVIANLEYLKGIEAGLAEVVLESPLDVYRTFKTESSTFDLRHQWSGLADTGYVDFIGLIGAGDTIADADTSTIRLQAVGTTSTQNLCKLIAERTGTGSHSLTFAASSGGVDVPAVYVDSLGNMGIGSAPSGTYALEVDGDLNIRTGGSFRAGGVIIEEWSDVGPGTATLTGNATATLLDSLQGSGTAPLSVGANTTECTNLNGNRLDGLTWHDELQGDVATTTVATSPTTGAVNAVTLDSVGRWRLECTVQVSIQSLDVGNDFDFFLDDGTSAIGRTVTAHSAGTGNNKTQSVTLFGHYTSSGGTETIRIRHTKAGGTGSSSFAATITGRRLSS